MCISMEMTLLCSLGVPLLRSESPTIYWSVFSIVSCVESARHAGMHDLTHSHTTLKIGVELSNSLGC